jgi:hypothetical protein
MKTARFGVRPSGVRNLIVLALAGPCACASDEQSEDDRVAEALSELGYSTRGVKVGNDYVTAEGDIVFRKDELLAGH